MASLSMHMRRQILPILIFTRLASLGGHAMSTTGEPRHIEITPMAMSRIVRAEHLEPGALVERQENVPLELDVQQIGAQSTTNIVVSGNGPTTTAIYAVGAAPPAGVAPNAISVPTDVVVPGDPGPPGPAGPPGPPGPPGSGSGARVKVSVARAPVAPAYGAATQSGYEIRGPPGPAGDDGVKGEKGGVGTQGLMGDIGTRGFQGQTGTKGAGGVQGRSAAANAPHKDWLMWGGCINGGIALIVFGISYMEFVAGKSLFSLCRRRKSVDGASDPLLGEEQYGGYEEQPAES